MTLALFVGLWTTTCIQTQIAPSNQGFVVESYEFSESGEYTFTRSWFEDASCSKAKDQDEDRGTLKLGPKMSGMFVLGETYEADFKSDAGTDYGALTVKEGKALKVARSIKGSNFRNSMVGVFEYLKQ